MAFDSAINYESSPPKQTSNRTSEPGLEVEKRKIDNPQSVTKAHISCHTRSARTSYLRVWTVSFLSAKPEDFWRYCQQSV